MVHSFGNKLAYNPTDDKSKKDTHWVNRNVIMTWVCKVPYMRGVGSPFFSAVFSPSIAIGIYKFRYCHATLILLGKEGCRLLTILLTNVIVRQRENSWICHYYFNPVRSNSRSKVCKSVLKYVGFFNWFFNFLIVLEVPAGFGHGILKGGHTIDIAYLWRNSLKLLK